MSLPPIADRCLCVRMHPHELIMAWQRRVLALAPRLLSHGYALDTDKMDVTLALIVKMEKMPMECFSDENAHHSHHLPHCPAARRNRDPSPPPEVLAETRARVAGYRQEAAMRWTQELGSAMSRMDSLFTAAGPNPR